ncbi:hypothetical protein [Candidatus Rhodobacter oscarellae]|uniref:hypothetical protein n=1 Tax=Candidatus Rhodobacter oscarellae TaxID=1675527 RepID=UPI00067140FF|nr:hypothetical protein [Candidatus Rhodobacter lobularis]
MKKRYITGSFFIAGAVSLLAVGAASADVYKCQVEARYTKGWFLPAYVFSHTRGEKQVMVESYGSSGERFGSFPARVLSEKGSKLRGRFDWDGARTTTGAKINVRYTATLDRETLSLKMRASVGRHGQSEHARGACVRVK